MKQLMMVLPLALILCFMVGCQDNAAMAELEAMKAQAEVEAKNIELIKRFFEEIDKENYEYIWEVCAPEYATYFPSGVKEPKDLEQGLELTKMFRKAIPDLVHHIEDIFPAGNRVTVRFIARGTHTGDIEEMGITATGNKIEVSSIALYRVENGNVVEERQDADMLALMQQLGMELKPKEGEK
ncbi:MAG: ester cyclase [Candidatus Aminicenantes bacterium]|jgi:predicted ester cyclase